MGYSGRYIPIACLSAVLPYALKLGGQSGEIKGGIMASIQSVFLIGVVVGLVLAVAIVTIRDVCRKYIGRR